MKKTTLLMVFLLFSALTFAQVLNQAANWPNTNWTVTGTYVNTAAAFEANPTISSNFAYDDDDAGSGITNNIAAESPVIDLTAAFNAGEISIYITAQYVYNNIGADHIDIQYWDADAAAWVTIGDPLTADTPTAPLDNFCTGTYSTYLSEPLNISTFTATQLSGFKYRISYMDGGVWAWGFCFQSPTIYSTSCPNPSSLAALTVTNGSIEIGWTENGAATKWNVQYGVSPLALGSGTIEPSTVNPYTISGLTGNTTYQIYIQANCGGGSYSEWIGPITVTTLCDPTIAPYTETFENAGAIPACWTQGATNAENWLFATSATYDGSGSSPSGGYFAWVDDSSPNNTGTSLLSPLVDITALTTPGLIFYFNSDNGSLSNVDFSVDIFDGTTWTNDVFFSNTDTSGWQFVAIDLTPYATSGLVQARFVVDENNGTDFENDLTLDDVHFDELPTCLPIATATATNITFDTAELSWTSMGTENAWIIEYGYDGFTLGTGTIENATTNPYGINNLDPNTYYDFYVTADCGNGDYAITIGPFSFKTECSIFPSPFHEPFSSNTLPDCWKQGATNAENWVFATTGGHVGNAGTITGSTASGSFFAYVDDSTPDNLGTSLVSPLVDISGLAAPSLIFFIISDNEGYSNVEFSVDIFDGTNWINDIYTSNDNTNGWQRVAIDLTPYYAGAPVQARFVVDENNIAGDFYDDFAIDDVMFDEMPLCDLPSNLIVSNVAATSADLSWTENGTATAWNVEYGPTGFTPGTGTIVNVVTNPATIEDIDDATTFDVYLQSDCSSSTSSWIGPITFTTLCLPQVAPYTQDFSNGGTIPNCWEQGASNAENWRFSNTASGNHVGNNGTLSGATPSGGYFAWVDDSSPNNIGTTLVTPLIDLSQLTTPVLSFYMISNNEGYTNVDFSVDFFDGVTWHNDVYFSNTNKTEWTKIYIDLSSYTITGSAQARFVVDENNGTDFYDDVAIDDVTFGEAPTSAPVACPANVVATPDASCGNFTSVITWDSLIDADGYYLTIGTTSGGNDILDNEDLSGATTYSFDTEINTTYYYTITPYNYVGTLTGCPEYSFTSAATGCYCTSVPTSNDNLGITNVTINDTAIANPDVTYADYTAIPIVATQSLSTDILITFATGYTYDTNIWIDFNDNYIFEASEQVFDGMSTNANPTVFDASFLMPADAPLGQHRMRIGTADSGQATPNPCYGGTYGITLDYTLDIQIAPSNPPSSCPANVVATPDPSCGNFNSTITWDGVSDASGYYITMGTTSGGADVLDNMDLATATTYTFATTINTTYYYTITPYNSNGSLTGCAEYSFTSAAAGCYCSSVPTSNDASGVTNVTIGTTAFPNPDVTYADYTATPVSVGQGVTTTLLITFATGYTYDTNIWIDFNDNYIFEASEQVFDGMSTNANPTVFDASFLMPATATLGQHTMRIGTADSGQSTPNPCYSGAYGITLDFTVDITTVSCTPASYTTPVVTEDCATSTFMVDIDITDLGDGTPAITDGTTTWPVTVTGVTSVGPFAFGTSATLSLLHGTDSTCDVPVGTYTFTACPPVNDDLCNALPLTVIPTGSEGSTATSAYTNVAATAQTNEPVPGCFNGGINGSVWFSFVAPASGEVKVTTDYSGATLIDTEIAVYDATGVTCDDLTTLPATVGCDQDGGTAVNYNSIILFDGSANATLTPGTTYYVQVDRWGTATDGTFAIEVIDLNPTATANFEGFSFTYYPNPVNNKELHLSASSEITNVNVFNLLGQQVLRLTPNASNYKVDMSQLSAGTYFVEVASGDTKKTVKIIKE